MKVINKAMPFTKTLLIFSLLWCPFSIAFPTDHHAFVATELSDWALDSYSHWDSEASSDFITYQRPLSWEGKWLRGQKVFDFTAGSISSKQFLMHQRLKIDQPLTDKLEFRFRWLKEGDFEQDRAQMPLELKYNFNSYFAFSLFGSPSLYKSEDDVGFSFYLKPSADLEVRASGAWGDYDRNQRNLAADKWSGAPFAATLSAKYLPQENTEDFLSSELHWEKPSQRTNAGAVTQDLGYESAYITGWKTLANGRGFGGRILYDRAFASDGAIPRARKRSLNQFEYAFIMGPHIVRPGINFFYRENRAGQDHWIYREVLPSVWMQLLPRGRSWGTGIPSLGYDATVFQGRHQQSTDRQLEHRLNLKYDMLFKQAGQLALLFTFDLDRFGSAETWEGGAAQFRLDF